MKLTPAYLQEEVVFKSTTGYRSKPMTRRAHRQEVKKSFDLAMRLLTGYIEMEISNKTENKIKEIIHVVRGILLEAEEQANLYSPELAELVNKVLKGIRGVKETPEWLDKTETIAKNFAVAHLGIVFNESYVLLEHLAKNN